MVEESGETMVLRGLGKRCPEVSEESTVLRDLKRYGAEGF